MSNFYRYALLMRPPAPGAYPRENLNCVCFEEKPAPSGHHSWGWAEYSHPLTEKQISDYELEPLSNHELDPVF